MKTENMRGTVSRVFFAAPDGPAMAGVLTLEDSSTIRFSGKCCAAVGDVLDLVGSWVDHPKFGRQFEAVSGLVQLDESPDAFVHLLATHSDFKGLGPVRARQVVDAALLLTSDGTVATALIDFPEEVATRANVSFEVVENAAKIWGEKRSYFDALAQLGEFGWSSAQAARIVAKYGDNAAGVIKSDPYMLIGKIERFGFRTVDAVAVKMGVKSTDPHRLQAGVAFCLDRIADGGNTWTTREGLLDESVQELRPDTLNGEDLIRDAIQVLIDAEYIMVDNTPLGAELVADSGLAAAELDVFARLYTGLDDCTLGELPISGPRANAVFPSLKEGQRMAVLGFALNRFGVISGGAGTGKTFTQRAICEIAEEQGLEVALCAPTGKAARKLSHATSRDAVTIHRLIETRFDKEAGRFMPHRTSANPLDADLVIVDEISMVDVWLMRKLLAALRPSCRLIMVGDHHQIPSVGPGAILRDLLAARNRYRDSVHVLTEIVRQAGVLARNTTALLDGLVVMNESAPWGIVKTEKGNETGAAAMAAVFVEHLVTSPEPLAPFERMLDFAWDVQILSPMRKGPLGTWALNVHLQKLRQRLLGSAPPEKTPENKAPKPMLGDRIIWTKNDYELNLFNGTQAIVVGMPKGGVLELFTEDGREVTIPASKRINVEVAYAMTIHKSQGSEWPCVLLVCSSAHWIMHDRNLFYTGASRASESLTLLGDAQGMRHFAQERKSANRTTFGSLLVHGWERTLALPPVVGGWGQGTSQDW